MGVNADGTKALLAGYASLKLPLLLVLQIVPEHFLLRFVLYHKL